MVGLRQGLSLTLCAKLVLLTIELCGMSKEMNRISLMTVLHQHYLTIEVVIFGLRTEIKRIRRNRTCFSNCVDSAFNFTDIVNVFADKYQELYTAVA